MQMYAVVATGVLGLLVGFWSGRSIRWKMEETEETVLVVLEYQLFQQRQLITSSLVTFHLQTGENA